MLFSIKLRAICVLSASLILSACGSNSVTVSTSFSNTQDIQQGTEIYLDGAVIGQVSDVELEGSGATVELSLDAETAKTLGSASAIVVNRLKQGAPLELINRSAADESLLQDGQSIKGLDSMLQLGTWMLGDAIQLGAGTASQYVESFQEYMNSDEFDQDKKAIQQQIDNAKEAAQDAMKSVEQELQKAAKDLQHTELEAAKTIQQLGDELAPMFEGLASTGAQLVDELEEFTAGLETADKDQQLAGQQFLESLLSTMEQFNQSMQKGISDADTHSDDAD